MICRESWTSRETLSGAALSRMAKWVRWSHSHTVTEELERSGFSWQPLLDQFPSLRMPSWDLQTYIRTYIRTYRHNVLTAIINLILTCSRCPRRHNELSCSVFLVYVGHHSYYNIIIVTLQFESVLLLCALGCHCSESGYPWDISQSHTAGLWTLYQIPTQCWVRVNRVIMIVGPLLCL